MITNLFRIIKYGIQSFRRNGLLSVATTVVMVLALLVFQGLIVFGVLTDTAILSIQDKIDISVYFKTNAPENEILNIKKSLENVKEVKSVEYVSREKALELFKEKRKDYPIIKKALEELDDNPLLASLNIKAHNPSDYQIIAAFLDNDKFNELTKRVTFTQSRQAIERLTNIVNTAESLGLALTILLSITAALITFNTIMMAIYSNREEIGIMRLVGAPNVFINGPYIVQAIIFGVLATILSLLIAAPILTLASPYISEFIPEMDLSGYFYNNLFNLFVYQLVFGSILAIVSGSIAIRKYLKL